MLDSFNFFETPSIVKKLGTNLFIKIPVFKNKNQYRVVYIDEKIYMNFFPKNTASSWQLMSKTLLDHFNVTIHKHKASKEQVGWAYVDKQCDPLKFALSGNQGSGRAYYIGQYFNLKGEKTPLATSQDPFYSNGVLDIEKGIRETLISHYLKNDTKINSYSILAILDLNESCAMKYCDMEVEVPRVIIIRATNSCSLERISHVFQANTKLSKQDLTRAAIRIGSLEGHKFIERVLHGAYSTGNISLEGHMLDLESVFCLKGRFPQYNITPNYKSNFFGFEYTGQLEILKALIHDKAINIDNVSSQYIEKTLINHMNATITQGFCYLMGFKNHSVIYKKYKQELQPIVQFFIKLSRVYFPFKEGLHSYNPISLVSHLFDFSKFFRLYTILSNAKELDLNLALSILCPQIFPDNKIFFKKKEYNVFFKEFSANSQNAIQKFKNDAKLFIKKYDDLYKKIMQEFKFNQNEAALRAYIINEDRLYLHPVFSLCYWFGYEFQFCFNAHTNKIMELLMLANSRKPVKIKGQYLSDIILYDKGYSYLKLNQDGTHQVCFSLWLYKIQNHAAPKKFYVSYQEDFLTRRIKKSQGMIEFKSKKINNVALLQKNDLDFFNTRLITVFYENKKIELNALHIVDLLNRLKTTLSRT